MKFFILMTFILSCFSVSAQEYQNVSSVYRTITPLEVYDEYYNTFGLYTGSTYSLCSFFRDQVEDELKDKGLTVIDSKVDYDHRRCYVWVYFR